MTEAELREALAERRQWVHQPGDRYYVMIEVQGCLAGGCPCDSARQARKAGASLLGHDDFHIAVVRGDAVVAVIWAMQLVDTDAEVLELVAKGLLL